MLPCFNCCELRDGGPGPSTFSHQFESAKLRVRGVEVVSKEGAWGCRFNLVAIVTTGANAADRGFVEDHICCGKDSLAMLQRVSLMEALLCHMLKIQVVR